MENNACDSVAVCALIKSYFYDPSPEELAENCVIKARPGDRYYGMSKESILKSWNERKEEGIKTHKSIENDYKSSAVYEYIKYYLDKGYEKHDEMNISMKTKKFIIKGRADCVLINHNLKKIVICEWKNCRYYYLKSDNKGFGPCENLYNTKFTKHILQCELYKVLLKNQYPEYNINTEVKYIFNNKLEKSISPNNLVETAVIDIINDLNK